MKKRTSLQTSPRYKNFIQLRDDALETILHKYIASHGIVMNRLWGYLEDMIRGLPTKDGAIELSKFDLVEEKLDFLFTVAIEAATGLFLNLRQSSYILAHAGEAHAIARSINKQQKVALSAMEIMRAKHAPGYEDALIDRRVTLYFNKLKRELLTQIERSIVMGETHDEAIKRLAKKYPKEKFLKRPPKQLRSLKEADTPEWLKKAREEYRKEFGDKSQDFELSKRPATELTTGIIDSGDWEKMVKDYKSKELPPTIFTRGAQDFIDEDGVRTYDWELENEMMNDFVKIVRSGQVDAANQNGITDFIWISVSHKTLCDHCSWRDGLTSEEIEVKLKGEYSDDPYDTIVPPAHPFCYCKLAPVTKELLDLTPDDSVEKEFDEWLNS